MAWTLDQGALKKSDVPRAVPTYLFWRLLEILTSDFEKHFNGVFELVMQRNGQKRG
jgi:hypothetical protein